MSVNRPFSCLSAFLNNNGKEVDHEMQNCKSYDIKQSAKLAKTKIENILDGIRDTGTSGGCQC